MPRPLIRRTTIAALSLSLATATGSLLALPALASTAGTGLVISEAYVNGGSANATPIASTTAPYGVPGGYRTRWRTARWPIARAPNPGPGSSSSTDPSDW